MDFTSGAIAFGAGLVLALALSLAPGRRLQALVVASQTGRATTARMLAGYAISEVVYAAGLTAAALGFALLPESWHAFGILGAALFFVAFAAYQLVSRSWRGVPDGVALPASLPKTAVSASSNAGIWFDMLLPGALLAAALGYGRDAIPLVATGYVVGAMAWYLVVAAAARTAWFRRDPQIFWRPAVGVMVAAGAALGVALAGVALRIW